MKALIIGTGPSLTADVIRQCNESELMKFGVNNTFRVIDLDVFHACNKEFYDTYWQDLKKTRSDKWTWHKETAYKYNLNYIEGIWADGLSRDKSKIHYHHGAGPQLVNIAYHYGVKTMYLVGWDMRYPGKIDRFNYTKPRHFFGDDELSGKHFPQTGPNGEMTGLIKEMETIKPNEYGIEIYNCTSDSAMTCFPYMELSLALTTP